MKTQDIMELAGTGEVVRIEAGHFDFRYGIVESVGVGYWTTAGDWSDRGVRVRPTDKHGTSLTHKTSTVVAPRAIKGTRAEEVTAELHREAQRKKAQRQRQEEHLADAAERREPLTELLAMVGPQMMLALDTRCIDAEQVRQVVRIIKQATVGQVQPGVYNVDVVLDSSFTFTREKVHSATVLDLAGEVIDLDRGRTSMHNQSRERLLIASAVLYHAE